MKTCELHKANAIRLMNLIQLDGRVLGIRKVSSRLVSIVHQADELDTRAQTRIVQLRWQRLTLDVQRSRGRGQHRDALWRWKLRKQDERRQSGEKTKNAELLKTEKHTSWFADRTKLPLKRCTICNRFSLCVMSSNRFWRVYDCSRRPRSSSSRNPSLGWVETQLWTKQRTSKPSQRWTDCKRFEWSARISTGIFTFVDRHFERTSKSRKITWRHDDGWCHSACTRVYQAC